MDVCSASSIVTWEGCVELEDTIFVAELDTTEHGVVEIGGISGVAIAASDHTTIDTCAVAVPCLEGDLRDRLTSPGVDDLDIKSQGYTRVTISDVLADVFARDPCREVRTCFTEVLNRKTHSMGPR